MNIGVVRCSDGKFLNTAESKGNNDWNEDGTLNYTQYISAQTQLPYRQHYTYTEALQLLDWTGWELVSPPAVEGAETNEAGTDITIAFSEPVEAADPGLGFTVSVNGDSVEIDDASVVDGEVVLVIEAVVDTDVVTVSYDATIGTLAMADTANYVESFADQAVTNNVPA